MKLFDIINIAAPEITPDKVKIHLACQTRYDDPLDILFDGGFEEWQTGQTARNFSRAYIIALISMGGGKWLFAGAYESLGCSDKKIGNLFQYRTKLIQATEEFTGRLIVEYTRSGRNSYRKAETIADQLIISEIKPERLTIQEFSGYSKVCISKSQLDTIIRQQISSWKAALSHVAGVYLITDRSDGRLYVGSATGNDGLWSRWSAYSKNGHGGNKELRELLREKGTEHASGFQYSILEIADTHASDQDVIYREVHWKNVLDSRLHGLNGN
jgi:hypothetical protein